MRSPGDTPSRTKQMSFFRVQSSASVMHIDTGSETPEATRAVELAEVSQEMSCSLKPAMVVGSREAAILEVGIELGKSTEQGGRGESCSPGSCWDVRGRIWACVCHGKEGTLNLALECPYRTLMFYVADVVLCVLSCWEI